MHSRQKPKFTLWNKAARVHSLQTQLEGKETGAGILASAVPALCFSLLVCIFCTPVHITVNVTTRLAATVQTKGSRLISEQNTLCMESRGAVNRTTANCLPVQMSHAEITLLQ